MKNWVCFVFLVTVVYSANVKRQFQGCISEGRTYQQGETWQKSCELNCVCQDASSGRYQCNSICPTYSDLPPSCILVKAPGECCAKPQCNFQPAVQGSFAGTGTGSGSGSGSGPVPGSTSSGPGTYPVPQTGTPTGGSCSDKIQTCNAYGTSVCSDQSYAKWVENNCCAYCRSNTGGTGTMTGGTGPMTGGTGPMTDGTGTITGGTGPMTGGTGAMTGGTGPMTGGTGTMTGGTGTMTGGTGTMTGGGSGSCTDKISNCNSYGTGVCSNPAYSQWVTENCGLYCGKCTMAGPGTGYPVPQPGSSTVTGGGTSSGPGTHPVPQTGTPTGGSCSDQIQTCNAYGTSICSDQSYAKWVENNCCAYCRSNTGGTGTMTGGTGTMTGGTGTITGGTGPMTGGTGTMTGGTGPMTGGTGTMTGGTGTITGGTGPMTGGTGTMTGGTGPMTDGTGTMTGGTGTMTGGTGTMTGGGSGSCTDKISNCNSYGTGVCSNPAYSQWVTENCGLYCGKCTMAGPGTGYPVPQPGSSTVTGGGTSSGPGTHPVPHTGTPTGGSCSDQIQTCNAYGTSVCSDQSYAKWVENNCCAYCRSNTGGTGTMTGGTGTMTGGTGTMTGGTGTITGGTGPMTGATGTMTGGTGTMTGGTGNMTGGGSGSCMDKISNCNTYGKSVCSNPTYSNWVNENCGLYCGKCGGTMTGPINGPLAGITGTMPGTGTSSVGTGVMPGTGTSSVGSGVMPGTGTSSVGTGVMPGTGTGSTSGTGGCVDKTTNCAQLDLMQHICSDTGAHFYVQTNCPQTCNLCPSTSCADKITNCAAYGSSVCNDATYSNWVTENCAKTCNKCSGAMLNGNGPMTGGTGPITGGTGPMTGGTGPMTGGTNPMTGGTGAGTGGMTGHSSGCAYKTQVYQQGQSWNDGCNLKCTCSDGSTGQYTCTALCVSWQLPSACTLSPPAPGKCCTTPSCPAGYTIQYPQGYQDN